MSRPALSSICRRCRLRISNSERQFMTSSHHNQDPYSMFTEALQAGNTAAAQRQRVAAEQQSSRMEELAKSAQGQAASRPQAGTAPDEPYHLNVYAHKHNTHITFTEPSRDVILSFSAGNIGLRKGQRGSFDAAYQLSTYTMRKMAEKSWRVGGKKSTQPPLTLNDPKVKERGVEIIMRGYGPGREAFQKAVLGSEGRIIKQLVKRVTDGTRLKFGGTRSPAVRRLG